MLQVEHQLFQMQLPASAGCRIGHLNSHLRYEAENVRRHPSGQQLLAVLDRSLARFTRFAGSCGEMQS